MLPSDWLRAKKVNKLYARFLDCVSLPGVPRSKTYMGRDSLEKKVLPIYIRRKHVINRSFQYKKGRRAAEI
jgi:hypothetical protein